jgi:rare lipoprotein A
MRYPFVKSSIWAGAALALALVIGGCSSPSRPQEIKDGPPSQSRPDLVHLPDAVPRPEPKSRYGNPDTYEVFGKTYRVMDSAEGYRAEGNASWYGRKFHGRRTSSGEPFDMYALTAAHRSLPIPTYAKVTNLRNNRSTIVRINDRGPFHADRIIDLSYATAVKLGFANSGTAPVRVEVIDFLDDFMLQAGAFSSLDSADRMQQTVQKLTGVRTYVVKTSSDSLYRVRVGPVQGETEAERLRGMIMKATGARPMIVPH